MHALKENHRIVWDLVTAAALTNVFGSVFNHRANSMSSVGHVRKDCR
jgi:hypothetical protein